MDVSEMTGASNFKSTKVDVNQIRINGENGKFFYGDLKNRQKGEELKETEIQAPSVVFLKIRRKLTYFDADADRFVSTTEHNDKYDIVNLYGAKDNVRGVADDIRQQFPNLRTQQVVYALYKNGEDTELVKVIVRGASLGSESKAKETTDFYSYLQSFTGDDHVHMFFTNIKAVEETSKMKKTYFAMDFKRGERLDAKQLVYAEERIKELYETFKAHDERVAKNAGTRTEDAGIDQSVPGTNDGVDYPTEELSPDDIPF